MVEKIKLLLVSKHFDVNGGGVSHACLTMAKSLSEAGFSTKIFSRGTVYTMGSEVSGFETVPSEKTALLKIKINEFDAVFIAGCWYFASLVIALKALLYKKKIIYAPKGQLALIEFKSKMFSKVIYFIFFELPIISICHKIFFTSNLEKFSSIIPFYSKKAVISPEWVSYQNIKEIKETKKIKNIAPDEISICFLAQISPRKGFEYALGGVKKLCNVFPDKKFVLNVGGEFITKERTMIKRVKLLERSLPQNLILNYHGSLTEEKRNIFLQSNDILLVPSYFESFSLVLVEGLIAGIHVIASKTQGILEFLPPGQNLYVMPELSENCICESIATVMLTKKSKIKKPIPKALVKRLFSDNPSQLFRENIMS
ncbi:glycosyltransferase family 4 protein [Alphaproteobacteria bacterium]|nr:glycosyltransferase family 4 protein [Alphaproteobacteria bacterium]